MARTARSLIRSTATVTGAIAAVAGVGLVTSPAASAAESWSMYDVDADGWLDPYAADLSGNGVADSNIVLVNGALMFLYDDNEDGRPDCYGTDNNGDGVDDLWGWDPNEDFVVDSWSYDPAVNSASSTFVVTVTLIWESQPYG